MFASLLPHHDDDGLAAVRLNAATAGALALVTFLILRLGLVVYRFFFHPLRKFPGPKLWAASDLPYTYSMHLAGTGIRQVTEFHKRYGPVIRVGPNRLALDGSVGWPQIFARRPGAEPEHEKAPKYFSPGVEYAIIGSARETHRRQRKQLAHAFSDASIHDQEKTISEYVQLLVQRIGEHAQSEKTLNIVQWLNFATFDIIGQLTYGESFGSLASSDYHPWVLGIFQGIQADSFLRACRVYPVMGTILTNLFPSKGIKGVENRKLAMAKGKARMELGLQPKKQKDFTTYMMQPNRDGKPGLSQTEIMANSPILVVAGKPNSKTSPT
ncbi:hypothetical protein TruAng_011828 [Truncatella angustata]|nr:hypothetical protein TruAng_011828 [Truncatella angustata]